MTSEFAVAVHALVYLNHKQELLTSEALANNICTNPARVRKVMAKLKKKKLIDTQEGINGGYLLLRAPEEIKLSDISEALELKPVSSDWKPGSGEMKCLVASGMAGIMEEIYSELNTVCQHRLEQITIAQINQKIFHKSFEDGNL